MSKSQAKNSEPSAEELAKGNEEIQADIQARFEAKLEEGSVVIVNLKENPMKVLGLAGLHSEATLTAAQLSDPRFYAKVERAKMLGLIKVK